MDAARRPLDFDRVVKGSIIPPAEIERITHRTAGTPEFNFAALNLIGAIERYHRARGIVLTCCIRDGAIRVLTDAEASDYNAAEFERQTRALARSFHRLFHVDVGQLNQDQAVDHERRVINLGKQVQALAQAGAPIKLMRHQRSVPGLPTHD